MANSDSAFGLRPVRSAHDTGYACALRQYAVAVGDTTPLYKGDCVVKSGTADAAGFNTVTRHIPGSAITGVVVGFADATSMLAGYRAASTAAYVLVADDPEGLFEVQEDADGGALAVASVGLNANLVYGTAANLTSAGELDTSSVATTATLDVKIIEFQQRADNEVASANAKVLVKINNHTERPGAAGL